jgi:hypothetical protein
MMGAVGMESEGEEFIMGEMGDGRWEMGDGRWEDLKNLALLGLDMIHQICDL